MFAGTDPFDVIRWLADEEPGSINWSMGSSGFLRDGFCLKTVALGWQQRR